MSEMKLFEKIIIELFLFLIGLIVFLLKMLFVFNSEVKSIRRLNEIEEGVRSMEDSYVKIKRTIESNFL